MARAEVGNAPAEVNDAKPELFAKSGAGAEPGFEVMVGGLPISPDDGGLIDGASSGAKVVNVERFENKIDVTVGFCKIVENKFGVFGESKAFVEMAGLGDLGLIEFVDGGVHAAVDC